MRRNKYLYITLLAVLGLHQEAVPQTVATAPRLVVNITIDQLRADYLETFMPLYGNDGFKKLLQQGKVFGTIPYYHGIVGTEWLDRQTLRPARAVGQDNTPTQLQTTTLGDEMKLASGGLALVYAFAPTAGEAVYAASKAFVLSFSQALYEETKRSNVSVLTVCPGVTDTDFFKSAGFELGHFKAASPESFAGFAYQSIVRKKPLSIHRFFNRMTALFCRLAPRRMVRETFAAACGTK